MGLLVEIPFAENQIFSIASQGYQALWGTYIFVSYLSLNYLKKSNLIKNIEDLYKETIKKNEMDIF